MHVEFKISDVSLTHKTHILESLDFHPQVWLLFFNDTCSRYVDYVIFTETYCDVLCVSRISCLNTQLLQIYHMFLSFLWSFTDLHFT